MKVKLVTISILVALSLTTAVSGCSQHSSLEGSKSKVFTSTTELANSSDAVVTGKVVGQSEGADLDSEIEFTISDFVVAEVKKGTDGISSGDHLFVRQVGSTNQTPLTDLLATKKKYLLYLVKSGLEAPLDKQFYITGGDSGLYADEGNMKNFKHLQKDGADSLPSSLSTDGALGK